MVCHWCRIWGGGVGRHLFMSPLEKFIQQSFLINCGRLCTQKNEVIHNIMGQWPLGTLGSKEQRIMGSERKRGLLIEAAQPLWASASAQPWGNPSSCTITWPLPEPPPRGIAVSCQEVKTETFRESQSLYTWQVATLSAR